MTTNIERAAEVIDAELAKDQEVYDALFGDEHDAISHKLRDAGLLMPDLPEPEMVDGRTVWRVDEEGFVYIKPDGRIATIGVSNPYDSPSIAYRHALALLAAADYAEQEQDNDEF